MNGRVASFKFSVFSGQKPPLFCRLTWHRWQTIDEIGMQPEIRRVNQCTRCGVRQDSYFDHEGTLIFKSPPYRPAPEGGAL